MEKLVKDKFQASEGYKLTLTPYSSMQPTGHYLNIHDQIPWKVINYTEKKYNIGKATAYRPQSDRSRSLKMPMKKNLMVLP
jgi:hypothetical protein